MEGKTRDFPAGGGVTCRWAVVGGHVCCGMCPTTLKGGSAHSIRSVPSRGPNRAEMARVTLDELVKDRFWWTRRPRTGFIADRVT